MLVGYCSPDSLGGALKRGDAEVKIFGETFSVRARVEVMDSFSAHADYTELIQFLKCQDPLKVKTLFLVHGEYENQVVFKQRLEAEGFRHIEIPEQGQGFVV
jgi:metallo-beta-lactamase family protein